MTNVSKGVPFPMTPLSAVWPRASPGDRLPANSTGHFMRRRPSFFSGLNGSGSCASLTTVSNSLRR